MVFKKLYSVLIKPFCVFICIILANLTLNIIVWYIISGVQPLMSPVCIHVVTWIAWVLCTFHLPAWHTGACIAAVPASKCDSNLVHLSQVVADCNIKNNKLYNTTYMVNFFGKYVEICVFHYWRKRKLKLIFHSSYAIKNFIWVLVGRPNYACSAM